MTVTVTTGTETETGTVIEITGTGTGTAAAVIVIRGLGTGIAGRLSELCSYYWLAREGSLLLKLRWSERVSMERRNLN